MTIRGHGSRISQLWPIAIHHLLTSCSVKEAAGKTGVSRVTLHRWMRDDNFAEALEESRKHVQSRLVERIVESVPLPAA
jgi:uncharacterized protein YjcR